MIKKVIIIIINIIFAYLTFSYYKDYKIRQDIILHSSPLKDYRVLKVDCSGGHRGGSVVYLYYQGKEYIVGITSKQCNSNRLWELDYYYHRKKDMIFEKNYLKIRVVIFFFIVFLLSLSLWWIGNIPNRELSK